MIKNCWKVVADINSNQPGEGGRETTRTDFSLREIPCYLSNTNEILPLLQQFIGEQDIVKNVGRHV